MDRKFKKKPSKRSKKFNSKGGVKRQLKDGGTATRKGRNVIRRRKGESGHGKDNAGNKKGDVDAGGDVSDGSEDGDDDFAGSRSIGNLDVADFMSSVADGILGEDGDEDSKDNEDDEDEGDEDGDDDGDEEMEEGSSGSLSSDDDDDSADDDPEAAATKHATQMKDLATKDPDFYKYLVESDKGLLAFGDNDNDDDDDGSDDGDHDADLDVMEDDGEDGEPDLAAKSNACPVLTMDAVVRAEKLAYRPAVRSVKALRVMVRAYASACHAADGDRGEDRAGSTPGKRFDIIDPAVFNRTIVVVLRKSAVEFRHHVLGGGDSEPKEGKDSEPFCTQSQLAKSPGWENVKGTLRTFLRSTVHLLGAVRDRGLLAFVLKSMAEYVPMFLPFPKAAKNFLKALISLWAAPARAEGDGDDDDDGEDEAVRLQAFLRIRQLALTQPFPFIEDCLKTTYLSYARGAKFVSETGAPAITLMGNCVVELYGLDADSSYRHGFVYIRQLALHLRAALQKKTKESLKAVYCWQYINCLRLWTAVLAAHHQTTPGLRPLLYPLIEIVTGTARLLPAAVHLPLRLHCVRILQRLAAASAAYVPSASILLEALALPEMTMRPRKKAAKAQAVRLPLVLRLSKEDTLRTPEQLDACVEEVFTLLNREADLYRYSPGFPEFSVKICQGLRRFCKENKNARYRAFARGCIEICEKYSTDIVRRRAALTQAPKDVRRLEFLKPPDLLDMGKRHEESLAREKRSELPLAPARSDGSPDADGKGAGDAPKRSRKKRKKAAKPVTITGADGADADAMDVVQEGVDWSDDGSDGGSNP